MNNVYACCQTVINTTQVVVGYVMCIPNFDGIWQDSTKNMMFQTPASPAPQTPSCNNQALLHCPRVRLVLQGPLQRVYQAALLLGIVNAMSSITLLGASVLTVLLERLVVD